MKVFWFILLASTHLALANVTTGLEEFFNQNLHLLYQNKKAALVTNHTGIDPQFVTTISRFDEATYGPKIITLFFPEHGLTGANWAEEKLNDQHHCKRKIYSLHGKTRRPSEEMLKDLDLIIYDIQDIGSRTYTYISTLFYVMEEAKKHDLEVVVLDRPNPMGGLIVDGPLLEATYRSFIGYVNTPYCHGMTVGELAQYFNAETKLNCKLSVVKMTGWQRHMTFNQTGLPWVPTSPYIPEADTPFFYASTGLFDSLNLVNIGIGYTLPFKIIGAPFIDKDKFATSLNHLKLPGVKFLPFSFKPFYGRYQEQVCQGVKIVIQDPKEYLPVTTAFALMGILKSLYPQKFNHALNHLTKNEMSTFYKVCGTEDVLNILKTEKFPTWKLLTKFDEQRKAFLEKRAPFLLY
jgi:uncharacterized protein YbbC (DUF1343 family)